MVITNANRKIGTWDIFSCELVHANASNQQQMPNLCTKRFFSLKNYQFRLAFLEYF